MTEVLSLKEHRTPSARLGLDDVASEGPDRRSAPRRKLVIEISSDLHRRIITICATRHVPVNQAVREVLEHAFPAK